MKKRSTELLSNKSKEIKAGKKAGGDRIVFVRWHDPHFHPFGWTDKNTTKKHRPSFCWGVGFVITETDDFLTIIPYKDKDHHSQGLTLPKACIIDIEELR